jgi:hypothetical protein
MSKVYGSTVRRSRGQFPSIYSYQNTDIFADHYQWIKKDLECHLAAVPPHMDITFNFHVTQYSPIEGTLLEKVATLTRAGEDELYPSEELVSAVAGGAARVRVATFSSRVPSIGLPLLPPRTPALLRDTIRPPPQKASMRRSETRTTSSEERIAKKAFRRLSRMCESQ